MPQKISCTDGHRRISLVELPDNLITNALRYLSTRERCEAELVCKTFREILSNPTPGDFVWDVLSLDDPVFQKAYLPDLSRQASFGSAPGHFSERQGVLNAWSSMVDLPNDGLHVKAWITSFQLVGCSLHRGTENCVCRNEYPSLAEHISEQCNTPL